MNLHPNIYIYIYKLAAGAMIMIWITYMSQSIMCHQSNLIIARIHINQLQK
jgi:hypothetical protein